MLPAAAMFMRASECLRMLGVPVRPHLQQAMPFGIKRALELQHVAILLRIDVLVREEHLQAFQLELRHEGGHWKCCGAGQVLSGIDAHERRHERTFIVPGDGLTMASSFTLQAASKTPAAACDFMRRSTSVHLRVSNSGAKECTVLCMMCVDPAGAARGKGVHSRPVIADMVTMPLHSAAALTPPGFAHVDCVQHSVQCQLGRRGPFGTGPPGSWWMPARQLPLSRLACMTDAVLHLQ